MSVSAHSSIATLLKRAGFPEFPLDVYGFPQPGAVIRYFREQMKYIDPEDHKEKCWRQIDLAERLGVSEITVRLMETKNNSLDSIERRRLLAEILKVPPILLGIGATDGLEEFLKNYQATTGNTVSAPVLLKGTHVKQETIKLYRDAFLIYSNQHSTSTAQGSIFEIEQWVGRIQDDLPHVENTQTSTLQRTLWDFHALTAKIYADDLCDWNNASIHLNSALELANLLNSNDLRSASLYRSAQIRFAQRNFFLAKSDLDSAIGFVKHGSPSLKGAIYAAASLAHALVDKDEAGRKYALSLMDQAGKYVPDDSKATDELAIKFSQGKYLAEKADTLITLGRPGMALDVLDDAEEGTNSLEARRLAYIDILRAEANMKLKNPQHDTATQLLINAFGTSSSIKSGYNIGYISRLYTQLAKSSYGNSTQVSDLGILLRNWSKGI